MTQGFTDNGLILRGGNTTNIMPPLCVSSHDVDEIVSAVDLVIGQTAHALGAT